MTILFCLSYVRPGFYHITVHPNQDYVLNAYNSSVFTFRESYPYYTITAKRGYLQNIPKYSIKSNTKYFSCSDSPLVLQSELKQTFLQWIVPSSICNSNGLIHNYGLSYKFGIDSVNSSSHCIFFKETSHKRYITMNTNSRKHLFTAEFYTDDSLNHNEPAKSCVNATVCSVMMSKPFFIRVELSQLQKFNLKVQITTLNISVKQNTCSTEIIHEIDDGSINNITKWKNIRDESCISFSQEIGKVQESLLEIIGVFLVMFILLVIFKFVNIRQFCCGFRSEFRFDGLANNRHLRELENPADTIHAPSPPPLNDSTTDHLVINVEDDETPNKTPIDDGSLNV